MQGASVSEPLTFANYNPIEHGPEGIYRIGAKAHDQTGVVQEMAQAFEHDLSSTPDVDNLGELIGKVGPAKELQANVGRVQEALGTDQDAVGIAQGWVERSGLLLPVERSFVNGDTSVRTQYGLAIITGGVRNWMQRRAEVVISEVPSQTVWLIGGNRAMGLTEGPDVEENMRESDYLREVIQPKLAGSGLLTEVVSVPSSIGDEVMATGARFIAEEVDLIDQDVSMIVVSNAGAWVQNTGQFRRAMRDIEPRFDTSGKQLGVVSDTFPVGTGAEPTSTHQNPFTALGQIARNTQELVRHL